MEKVSISHFQLFQIIEFFRGKVKPRIWCKVRASWWDSMYPLGPGALASCTEEHQLLSWDPVSSVNYSFFGLAF